MRFSRVFPACSIFLLLLLAAGCSTVPDPDKRPHVPEGAALLIVYDPGSMIIADEWHVELNGRDYRRYGGMDGNEYFAFELWPGKHRGYAQRAGLSDVLDLTIGPSDVGRIYLWRMFDNITSASVYSWEKMGGEVQDMELIKRFSAREASPEITLNTAHGKARYYGPVNSQKRPIMSGVLEWRDGRKMEATFSDARSGPYADSVLRYTASSYRPAASGVLEYPDGRRFVGDVLAKETDGVLYDQYGNVTFSGTFKDGKPHGWGFSRSFASDEPQSTYYRNGFEQRNPVQAAADDTVRARLEMPENETTWQEEAAQRNADKIRRRMSKARNKYKEMSGRCACFGAKLCMTRVPKDETPEERRLRKERKEKKRKICKEWFRNGISSRSELDAKLDSLQKDYERKRNEVREMRRARERAYERKQAEYRARYQQEMAAELRRIAQERKQALAEKRQECRASESESISCACAPFVENRSGGSPKTCGR